MIDSQGRLGALPPAQPTFLLPKEAVSQEETARILLQKTQPE